MARKRRQRLMGIVPRLGRALWAWARGALHHPQPFILGVVLVIACWALWSHARRMEAFRITQVVLPSDGTFTLREPLLNANLWDVDLHALAEELKQQQPWLKEIRVIRHLPNTIRVEAIPRTPVAQVRLAPPRFASQSEAGGTGRWHPVDRDGFLLPEGSSAAPPPSGGGVATKDLVRLSGVDRGGAALRVGKANTDERLLLALRILQKLRRTPALVSRRLTEINVADPRQIRFVLDDELEVRCGSEPELDAHLSRLRASLRAVSHQPFPVKYIDVRFQEPVVGPRT